MFIIVLFNTPGTPGLKTRSYYYYYYYYHHHHHHSQFDCRRTLDVLKLTGVGVIQPYRWTQASHTPLHRAAEDMSTTHHTSSRATRMTLMPTSRPAYDAIQHDTCLCSACYGGCKRDTARICCCGAVAAGRPAPAAVDHRPVSCQLAAQQQTRRTPLLRSINGTDGQTDGRT